MYLINLISSILALLTLLAANSIAAPIPAPIPIAMFAALKGALATAASKTMESIYPLANHELIDIQVIKDSSHHSHIITVPADAAFGSLKTATSIALSMIEQGGQLPQTELRQSAAHAVPIGKQSPTVPAAHLIQDSLIDQHFPSSKYQVLKFLGSGFSGRVFLVKNTAGEELALKIISASNLNSKFKPSSLDVEREWKILNHPAVNQAFGKMTKINARFYLPMKYLPGQTWESHLESEALSKADNDAIMTKVLEQVRNIHAQGIIHGDLAARNIILDSKMNPTLIDWGLAKESRDPSSQQQDILGLQQELRTTWNYYW